MRFKKRGKTSRVKASFGPNPKTVLQPTRVFFLYFHTLEYISGTFLGSLSTEDDGECSGNASVDPSRDSFPTSDRRLDARLRDTLGIRRQVGTPSRRAAAEAGRRVLSERV